MNKVLSTMNSSLENLVLHIIVLITFSFIAYIVVFSLLRLITLPRVIAKPVALVGFVAAFYFVFRHYFLLQ